MSVLICPLCSQSRFDTIDSLRNRLVSAATQNITCPICSESLLGLDKFTIHLFGHTLVQELEPTRAPSSIPPKLESLDDPLSTVNMEDLNFLTSWDTCCKAGSSHGKDKVKNQQFIQSSTQTDPEELERDNSIKAAHVSIENDESSTHSFSPSTPEQSNSEYRLRELHLEIHNSSQELNTQEVSTKIFPNNSSNNDVDMKSIESVPTDIQIPTIAPKYLNSNTSPHDVNAQAMNDSINQTLSVLPETSTITLQNYLPLKPIVSLIPKEEVIIPQMSNMVPEEILSQYMPTKVSDGDMFCRKPEQITAENRELSEYMAELLKQKLPASNFLFTLPKVESNQALNCEKCGSEMENNEILEAHLELVHVSSEPYACKHCGRSFKMRGSLLVHTRVAHAGIGMEISTDQLSPEPRNFHCTVCSKSFKKEQHLTQHMKTHDGKQWQCETCCKFFTTKYFLKKHQRLHTGEMPYCCETCKKTFTFQQSYHKHLLYHSADKPHECQECGRAFKELSTLHNHQRIHSGEKPFACETCGKCFRQRVSYIVHQRIHTGVLPYQCTACKKKFRYKVSQRSHKCTAQPPGIVVRQPGDLIQRILEQRQNILQGLE